ncbi:Pyruvate-flavodoxin oxidoreductase [Arcticibacter svalbardensis MN12-7]|uniref:Pyruvate-flavodoxin oxidoreductase n=1 Tax=Arcticibacter svalbardensis MN12-7 TaxID=1150600 RepID=R9GRV4_9SPHI|nr:pyruvate:ferredoxin (flavodoxin) oxidoreductase [Arcticibacter svalbardensis]EOR94270.1 Pyruvate-flavodoxin oxidoreductase [Arcticibacter svalbardensis MN12-7]
MSKTKIIDGNQAAAHIAYKTSEVCAIYPITPSSAMGEWAEEWSSDDKLNIYGEVPSVTVMQSEGGAAGAVHGALQAGVLSSTFTCSQGLLLMIPNMYKIAGELSPTVFHIAARALATHALSIFGDHSDVMAVRSTGFAMLFGSNPQEAHDMAMIATSASLSSSVPFMNIFDGFRTSHELNSVEIIPDETIMEMISDEDVARHRNKGLNPAAPVIRGTTQNPDVYFQSREACNSYYLEVPSKVEAAMVKLSESTGRAYKLFDFYGDPEAEQVIIIMGSGAGAVYETVDYLNQTGEKTGCLQIHLYRPFSIAHFVQSLPVSVKSIAVLDRCKEPGSIGEPLYMDVISALHEGWSGKMPTVIRGRYGLGSKEFNPGMVKAIFEELKKEVPQKSFTIGILDDITHLSLAYDKEFSLEKHLFRGLFYGLGADGTVSANKNTIKIIGEVTDHAVQGYFVYDSKKSGSLTVSHLRFSAEQIRSSYLINSANFIACHQFTHVHKYDLLQTAEKGATFLLNAPYSKEEVWDTLPKIIQDDIINKQLKFYVVNASKVARETGMGSRINGILQTCFFAISGVIPQEEAIGHIKASIKKTYGRKGEAILEKNYNAVDKTLENLFQVDYSGYIAGNKGFDTPDFTGASDFVQQVLSKIISGDGEEIPVSALPADGTFPTGTTCYEKRNVTEKVPVWNTPSCTQCGKCFIICPHAAIRPKVYDKALLENAPESFKYTSPMGREFSKDNEVYSIQVAVEDCTGCNLCVEVCPVTDKLYPGSKALKMEEVLPIKEVEKVNWKFFLSIPEIDRTRISHSTVRTSQLLQPLFEFSGACSGCGETPYLKLLTQLFGSRMIVANATGCSSIYGGNLPTTPWTKNCSGHGPAWANSLFEDNAEFGLGIKLATDKKQDYAFSLLKLLEKEVGSELSESILLNPQETESDFVNQQKYVGKLKELLAGNDSKSAKLLLPLTDFLENKSIWIIGGDGWAYDIDFGGIDHVLSTGQNVNIMVMDTEVYSNTGGQKSKSTPIGASAKFATKGKTTGKKDLAMQAIAHGTAYVAEIAIGANDAHALKTIIEAEAYPGPSLIIAYSHCISHGYDIQKALVQQSQAVKTGYWPLFRYNPLNEKGERFMLDCREPSVPLEDFLYKENRFATIKNNFPEKADEFLALAKEGLQQRWERIEALKLL